MIKGKEILGRPIIAISSGEKVDTVRDVVFDHQGNQVLAFLTDEGGWFRAARAVPFERVRSIGEHAVMIATPDDVTSSRDDKRLGDALESKTSLLGLTLLTPDGQNLGRIADVYFDEHTGAVVGYEATGGLFADLSSGRTFIPAPSDVQIGPDAAIVPLEVATAMKEHPGGWRGALRGASEAVSGAVQHAGDAVTGAVQDATQNAKTHQKALLVGKVAGADIILENGMPIVHKGDVITQAQADAAERAGKLVALTASVTGGELGEAVQEVRERVQVPVQPAAPLLSAQGAQYVSDIQASIGRRIQHDIRAPGGSLLAVQGQIVTPELVHKAESLGLGQQVVAATAQPTQPQPALAEASAALSDGVEQVREGASHLLHKARAWLSDRRDETEQAFAEREHEFEEQRIRDALGRPVTRVILAPDDSIILNVGEIITNRAIQAARAGQVLDMLLDSASKEAPVIDPITVRPEETGAAALESQLDLKK